MSTPTPLDDSKFQQDNQAFLDAITSVQNQNNDQAQDTKDYEARLHSLSPNPEIALVELFFMLYASPGNDTMGGLVQDDMGVTGEKLKLNGALTAADADLNNMVNSNNDYHDSNNISTGLDTFANDTSTLMGELKNLPDSAMDTGSSQSVLNNLTAIRKFFDVTNPTVPSDNPGSGDTFYFKDDYGDTNYIYSFKDYQTCLGEQGNVKNSTDAGKHITDDFSTNTQTTQTTSAVLNNDMKTYSPLLQAIQQFVSSIAQLINAIKKASITHTSSGS